MRSITILRKGTNGQYYRVYVRYSDGVEGWLYTNNVIYYSMLVSYVYLVTIVDGYITEVKQ
jgi:hypothetical protein